MVCKTIQDRQYTVYSARQRPTAGSYHPLQSLDAYLLPERFPHRRPHGVLKQLLRKQDQGGALRHHLQACIKGKLLGLQGRMAQ